MQHKGGGERKVKSVFKVWGIIVPKARHAQTAFVGVAHVWSRSVQNVPSVYRIYHMGSARSPANVRALCLLRPNMPHLGVTAWTFIRISEVARLADGLPTRFLPRVSRALSETLIHQIAFFLKHLILPNYQLDVFSPRTRLKVRMT